MKSIKYKYTLAPNNISINNNILGSDDTQLLNDTLVRPQTSGFRFKKCQMWQDYIHTGKL